MTRYILNSAVITSEGTFRYQHLKAEEAKGWLQKGPFTSTVGYAETAQAMSLVLEDSIPVNRKTVQMKVGDEALVFRLVLPPGERRVDPSQKGALTVEYILAHCEIGLLTRTL